MASLVEIGDIQADIDRAYQRLWDHLDKPLGLVVNTPQARQRQAVYLGGLYQGIGRLEEQKKSLLGDASGVVVPLSGEGLPCKDAA